MQINTKTKSKLNLQTLTSTNYFKYCAFLQNQSNMIAKIVVAVCLATIVQGNETRDDGHLTSLKLVTEEVGKKILEILSKVQKSSEDFDEITSERLESVLWDYSKQKTAVNKTVKEALFKGMIKNKLFPHFQCISSGSDETFRKLEEINSKILETSRKIKDKGLSRIKPFGLILSGLYDFVQDLQKEKSEDLMKANEEEKVKIMNESEGKLNLMKVILERLKEHLKELKFKFYEEHIEFTFQTENALRKIQKEGSQKILKCVA